MIVVSDLASPGLVVIHDAEQASVAVQGPSQMVQAQEPIRTQLVISGFPGPPGGGAGNLPLGGNIGDVVTKTASGSAWQAPSIPWNSTNW